MTLQREGNEFVDTDFSIKIETENIDTDLGTQKSTLGNASDYKNNNKIEPQSPPEDVAIRGRIGNMRAYGAQIQIENVEGTPSIRNIKTRATKTFRSINTKRIMTQRFTTGQAFASGDQVTAQKLEDIVEKATPLTALTDDTSTTVSGGQIIVKTATGAANGITLPKIAHQPANTVLVRDANSEGAVSAKAVTDTQILIGDGTGFTAAALSGDVTMTNAGVTSIKDDVALGGTPTAATASESTNTTQIATTAYVKSQLNVGGLGYATLTLSSQTFSASGGTVDHDITDSFTISNNGITVSQSGADIAVPSGIYLITYNIKDITFDNPAGSSSVLGRMKIERDGTTVSSGSFEAGENLTVLGNSLSGVFTGGVNFNFVVGRKRGSNTSNTQGMTPNNIEIAIVRLA